MDLIVNDLSLHGQFADSHAFRDSIARVMLIRQIAEKHLSVLPPQLREQTGDFSGVCLRSCEIVFARGETGGHGLALLSRPILGR